MDKYEVLHLEQILQIANQQLEASVERSENKQQEILEAKKEQRENTVHSVGSLYSNDGFEDLIALNQYAQQVSRQIDDYEAEIDRILRLEKIIKSPYFARIDFKFGGEDSAEEIYIGRFQLTGDKSYDIRVYDWRSPIASVFYRFGMGSAFYDAPSGKISGEICLKRQYEIKNSLLEYYFDTEVQIIDEFLKKLLAQNASKSMKSIVETIQKEQDTAIRDLQNDLMIVQGVAGSGKSSVALHRAAYLMYQGLANKLSSSNILIISPNSLFERYISNVLPELGEDNVVSYVFEEIITEIIKPRRLQSYRAFLETLMENEDDPGIRRQCFDFKTSAVFALILKEYLAKNGNALSPKELYIKLLNDRKFIRGFSGVPQNINELLEYSSENAGSKNFMFYDDALCLTFIHLCIRNPIGDAWTIKQVIIDEAQDYTPLHFEILNQLYPKAKFTVLGDVNQAIERKVSLDFYEEISSILNRPKSTLITLNKSFRCSRQILNYGAQFLDSSIPIESFCRDGDEPIEYSADSIEELDSLIISEIDICIQQGYQSIAIICDRQNDASMLYKRLSQRTHMSLVIDTDDMLSISQVFAIPLYMAKGLEFDAVLVYSVADRQHLYIACTRALHRLALYSTKR